MLTLPIKKKWFDMILNGEKKEEYREIKPYYTTRFYNLFGSMWMSILSGMVTIHYGDYEYPEKEIYFRNGYSKSSPSFIARCSLSIGIGKPEWGAEPEELYYVLKILEVEEVKNGREKSKL